MNILLLVSRTMISAGIFANISINHENNIKNMLDRFKFLPLILLFYPQIWLVNAITYSRLIFVYSGGKF